MVKDRRGSFRFGSVGRVDGEEAPDTCRTCGEIYGVDAIGRDGEAGLQDLAQRFAQDAEQSDVYAYFMHEDAPDGPLRARAVLEALRQ